MIVAVVVSLPFVYILLTQPVLRRLAIRNAMRRPREAILVIAGSLLGTALMTASFVVGDTLTASISAGAKTQYGPIDEVVSVGPDGVTKLQAKLNGLTDRSIDGVLPITTLASSAAVVNGDGTAKYAAPTAQMLELDFAAAQRFGGDPSTTGIAGSPPGVNEAVLVESLANRLHVRAGDRFTMYALNQSRELRVARVMKQHGVAGFWRGREVVSYNAFVAPGTIKALTAKSLSNRTTATPISNSSKNARAAFAGINGPLFSVLISNRGGVVSGADATGEAVSVLVQRLVGVQTNVLPVKKNLLDAARKAGNGLQDLYQTIGSFAVFAGILLLINIFTMLAEERKSELGMMRAMGLRRRALVGTFASEGWLYAIAACTIGTALGLGVGRLVIEGAARITSTSNRDFRSPMQFHFTPASLQNGFVIGLVIAIVTVVGTSVATSRFNIIAAIRDLDRVKTRGGRWRGVLGGLFAVLGAIIGISGVAAKDAGPLIMGPALIALGLALFLNRHAARRSVTAACSAACVVWGAAGVPVGISFGAQPNPQVFLIQGLVLVVPAVLLVGAFQSEIGHFISKLFGDRLTVRLGLAYPLARRQRTALTLGQFSIVVFILTYITVLSTMFKGQTDQFAIDVGGGRNTVVDARPLDLVALRSTPGVRNVAGIVRQEATITVSGDTKTTLWPMAGIDESFLQTKLPHLSDTGEYRTEAEAYAALIKSDSFAIIDDRFLSLGGPPVSEVKIGDSFNVKDRVSGVDRDFKVIAISGADLLFNGGMTSARGMRAVFGAAAAPSRAYLTSDAPTAFASSFEAKGYKQGTQAFAILDKVRERVAQQNSFFGLIRSFLSIGLVVGVAGIGVIMVRAVRERRRQVGVLRALGFSASSVKNAFAIEATFVALEGIVLGVVLGLVATWSISLSDLFGAGFKFAVPYIELAILVLGTLVGSLIATISPARSAAKIKPAVALRIAD